MKATIAKSNSSDKKIKTNILASQGCILLRPDTGRITHVTEWTEPLIIYFERTYGDAGTFMRTGVVFEPPKITYDDEDLTPSKDPHGFYKTEIAEKMKLRTRTIHNLEALSTKMYADLWSSISLESEAELRKHPNFLTVETSRDPVALRSICRITHMLRKSGDSIQDRLDVEAKFMEMIQQESEPIHLFHKRFADHIALMKEIDAHVAEEFVLAAWFIRKLNSNFDRFRQVLEDRQVMATIDDDESNAQIHPDDDDDGSTRGSTSTYGVTDNVNFPTVLAAYNAANRWEMRMNKTANSRKATSKAPPVLEQVYSVVNTIANNNNNNTNNNNNNEQKPANSQKKKKWSKKNKPTNDNTLTTTNNNATPAANMRPRVSSEAYEAARKASSKAFEEAMQAARVKEGVVKKGFQGVHFAIPIATFEDVVLDSMHDLDPEFDTIEMMYAQAGQVGPMEVLLDNQATIGCIKNKSLLSNIRPSGYKTIVSGVGGSIETTLCGDMRYFGTQLFQSAAPMNILSENRVRDLGYKITIDDDTRAYTVHVSDQLKFVFELKYGGLHVCDMSRLLDDTLPQNIPTDDEEFAMVHTVVANEANFSKHEVIAAKGTREWMRRAGYPSPQQQALQIRYGTVKDNPYSQQDVSRAAVIYGPDLPSLKGKSTHKKGNEYKYEAIPRPIPSYQTLFMDIMFVCGIPFLLSLSYPLGLLIATRMYGKGASQLLLAATNQLASYAARAFQTPDILMDNESALSAITPQLNEKGYIVNPAGPGDHVKRIERQIRTVKERVRCHVTSSPFAYSSILLIYCVLFCTQRLNMELKSTRMDNISPKEHWTGIKTDYNRDYAIGFGDYVQVSSAPETSNSVNDSRTIGAIALLQTGHLNGSVKFLTLHTWEVITRTKWTVLPMPQEVVDFLNAKARAEKVPIPREPVFARGTPGNIIAGDPNTPLEPLTNDAMPNIEFRLPTIMEDAIPQPLIDNPAVIEIPAVKQTEYLFELPNTFMPEVSAHKGVDNVEDLKPADFMDNTDYDPIQESADIPIMESNDELDPSVPDVSESQVDHHAEQVDTIQDTPTTMPQEPTHGYNLRPKRVQAGTYTRRAYGLHMTILKSFRQFGQKPTLVALAKEALNIHIRNVNIPVIRANLTRAQRRLVIKAYTFLKEKLNSKGEFEKLKARTVANGSQMDRSVYSDVSSPTVATSAVFIIAAIAAAEGRHVMTCDIGGAYLNADMTDEVYVHYDADMAALFCECDSSYRDFLEPDGTLVCKLNKALYGCVQSGKLWNEKLTSAFIQQGFTTNELDKCVFNKIVDGVQITVAVHVDDCMCTCVDLKLLQDTAKWLKEMFNDLSVNWGTEHSYLGMTFRFPAEAGQGVNISMEGYIEELMHLCKPEGTNATPASERLFVINPKSKPLNDAEREKFHSVVAKILYLAKRTRPDVLLPIAFLASRVLVATTEDQEKLDRVLKYLNGTRELCIRLDARDPLSVFAYLDASHGVHADGKGHTGVYISLFKGGIHVKSSKQKINSKSSTESELIGLSDGLSQVIWTRDFLCAQGYSISAAVVYQDNKSTIVMANKGASTSERTRHIGLRYFFVKDRVDSGEVTIQYLPTENMIADILTKPLQGSLFRRLRNELMNIVVV